MDYTTGRQIVFDWKTSTTVADNLTVNNIDSSLIETDDFNRSFLKAGVIFLVNGSASQIAKEVNTEAAVNNIMEVSVHDSKLIHNNDGTYTIKGVFLRGGKIVKKNMDKDVQALYSAGIPAFLQSNGIYVLNK